MSQAAYINNRRTIGDTDHMLQAHTLEKTEMPHGNKWRNLERMPQKQDGVKVSKPNTWLSKLSNVNAHFAQNHLAMSHTLNKRAASQAVVGTGLQNKKKANMIEKGGTLSENLHQKKCISHEILSKQQWNHANTSEFLNVIIWYS